MRYAYVSPEKLLEYKSKLFNKYQSIDDFLKDVIELEKNHISSDDFLVYKSTTLAISKEELQSIFESKNKFEFIPTYLKIKNLNFSDDELKTYLYRETNNNYQSNKNHDYRKTKKDVDYFDSDKRFEYTQILKKHKLPYEKFQQYKSIYPHQKHKFETKVEFLANLGEYVTKIDLKSWEDYFGENIYEHIDALKLWTDLGYDAKKVDKDFDWNKRFDIDMIKKLGELLKLKIDEKLIKKGINKNLTIEQIKELQKKKNEELAKLDKLLKKHCNGKFPQPYNFLTASKINPYATVGECYILGDASLVQAIDKNSGLYNLTFLWSKSESYIELQFDKIAPAELKLSLVKSDDVTTLSDNSKVPVMKYIDNVYDED